MHEVPGPDHVWVHLVGLDDELEAPPDLLLAHRRDGHNLLEGPAQSMHVRAGVFLRYFPATDAYGFSKILSYWQKFLEL